MRRSQVVLFAGCLLVAGGAGAGTASGDEPGDETSGVRPPTVVERPSAGPRPGPGFPGPDPRMVEPDRRPPGSIPHVAPEGPDAVPMPELGKPRSRPVPMPELKGPDGLAPLDELLVPRGPRLSGGSQSPGD